MPTSLHLNSEPEKIVMYTQEQDTTLYISQERYEELAEQFNLYYYESGMSGEMDCDYATAEWNYISNELGTSDWCPEE